MIMLRRPLLRAAVVGGGAYLAGKNAAQRQEERQYAESMQDRRLADLEQQRAAAAQPVPAQPASQVPSQGTPSLVDQLDQLSAMHEKGALTDEEFAAAKARLLGAGA